MSQNDSRFEYSAEELVNADSPVIIVSDSVDEHCAPETIGDIAEYLAADVLATRETWNVLSVSSESVTHVGPPSQDHFVGVKTDVLLAVGYQLSEDFITQIPVDYSGYFITLYAGHYTLAEYHEWCEEAGVGDRCSRPDRTTLNDLEESIEALAEAVERVAAASSTDENEEVTIYSSPDDEYPDPPEYDELEAGEPWRVATARKCPVCHTMTNKRLIGGYPSRGPRQYCPANQDKPLMGHIEPEERHEKHEELSELLSRREELEQRLAQYDVDSDAGERTINSLHHELEVIDEKIRTLREWFGERFDDVKGINPDREKVSKIGK